MSRWPDSSYARSSSSRLRTRLTPIHCAAVVGLHEQRVADLLGDRGQVERQVVAGGGVLEARVVRRVLVRDQHRRRHLEPEPDHRAVGRVLLHRLERERAVEQVHVVHQRDLLQPLAREVVPVREPVDHQLVARAVAQVERLDRDPLGRDPVAVPGGVGDRPEPRDQRLERARPVVLGAEQQADQVASSPLISRSVADGGRAARARTANRARRRTPTGRARTGCPWTAAARRSGAWSRARRSCPPTAPARTRAAG